MNKTPLSTYSILLHLIFFSLPLVATLKGKGTVIMFLGVFLLHARSIFHKPFFKQLPWKSSLALMGFALFLWASISCLWAPYGFKALFNCLRYAGLLFLGFLVYQDLKEGSAQRRSLFFKAFLRGVAFFMVFQVMEIHGPAIASRLYTTDLSYNKGLFIKGIVTLCALFWPALLYGMKRSKGPFLFAVLSLALMLLALKGTRPDSAYIGLMVGGIGGSIAYFWPRLIKFMAGGLMLFLIAMPFIFTTLGSPTYLQESLQNFKTSHQHRLYIWESFSQRLLKNPLRGYGFDYASSVQTKDKIRVYMPNKNPHKKPQLHPKTFNLFSSHTHNGVLQIWLELGILGLALALCTIWILTKRIALNRNPAERFCAWGFFLYYMCVNLVGFGLWQKWLAATVILTLLSFLCVPDSE